MKFKIDKLALIVRPENDDIFSERATRVSIEDEAAGCFVEVAQHGSLNSGIGKIQITRDEWPCLREAIETMLDVCDSIDESTGPETGKWKTDATTSKTQDGSMAATNRSSGPETADTQVF